MAFRNRTAQALNAVAQFQQVHAEVWNLLPWYVNGTLDADDLELVEAHLTQCLTCRTELAEQTEIARLAAETDVLDSVMETSLAKMHERLAAEGAAVPPSGSPQSRAPKEQRSWTARIRRQWERLHRSLHFRPASIGLMGGVPAMAVVAFLIFGGVSEPPVPFTTLSDGEAEVAGPVLRVKVSEEANSSAVAASLAEQGLHIIEGPSPYGVYTLTPVSGGMADAEEAMTRLRDTAFVEFVTLVEP